MGAFMNTLKIDGYEIPFAAGQTIMDAALAAGVYIPHLCHHPDFTPHGSCKLCTVKVNGRSASACTLPASESMEVENNTAELNAERLALVQMLFVEGNHLCPTCEKSGNCQLQALAYHLNMLTPHYNHFYPPREVDASHPEVFLDRNRCILCELCVRASRDVDGKEVFGLSGRGASSRLIVNSPSGRLADSAFAVTDKAAQVCPTGAILLKRVGFAVPIGERIFDRCTISESQSGGHRGEA
jgi:[NiFe] hydrogenase diaphorase moiety small subunit